MRHPWLLATLLVSTAYAQSDTVGSAFADAIYPILEAAQCRGCHTRDGVASATRLHFPESEAPRERVEAFGLSLAGLKSLIATKPTNRERHTGGERIKQGSPEEKKLLDWVQRLATVPPEVSANARKKFEAGGETASLEQFLRRLTHSQYNNTVRDLMRDYSRPADRFPPEDFVNGFKNQLRTQGMPPLLAEVYSNSAEKIALNAFRAGDVNGLIPCKPDTASDVKCRDEFIRRFGRQAFRRPLTAAESERYAKLFTAQANQSGKFLEGARAVVEAILQSPKFLFHIERGPGGRFRDYEIASRLSYFLWDTMPDQRLLDAAARGDLRTGQGVEKIARGMFDDPRAKQALDEFFTQWLRFDRVLNSIKDRRRFPEFTPELAANMVEETKKLLSHLVWNDQNFIEALTAEYSFLNSDLTALYALPAPAGEFERVSLPADSRRAGLLGHASFLASTAGPAETSPTARGIFIREQLLCQHVPNPPPGVNTTLPEPTAERPLTMRQRMQAHIENPTCAACHKLMDPIGLGLENFDGIGRWRDKEIIELRSAERGGRPKRFELELDPQGEIAGIVNSAFSTPKQLGRVLADSKTCQECIVKQVFRYAYGRMETDADRDTISRAYTAFRTSGFRFKELLIALVRSPQFLEGVPAKDAYIRSQR